MKTVKSIIGCVSGSFQTLPQFSGIAGYPEPVRCCRQHRSPAVHPEGGQCPESVGSGQSPAAVNPALPPIGGKEDPATSGQSGKLIPEMIDPEYGGAGWHPFYSPDPFIPKHVQSVLLCTIEDKRGGKSGHEQHRKHNANNYSHIIALTQAAL